MFIVTDLVSLKKDFLSASILRASQNDASEVTSWSYSCFLGKMTIPGYKFKDSLHFMHRKRRE